MDIHSRSNWPSRALSNFALHPFTMDGVECASMEGFLQSLKFKSPEMQVEVCKLVGRAAKQKGSKKTWWRKQTLWWQGVPYERKSEGYQELLERAYYEMATQNKGFRNALLATRGAPLTHSIGKKKQSETILTESEFCGILRRIREDLIKEE